jgi:hypothetical protein
MLDIDTDLPTLYVIVDEYCKSGLPAEPPHHGPHASLSHSEVVTLAVFGPWSQFESERGDLTLCGAAPVVVFLASVPLVISLFILPSIHRFSDKLLGPFYLTQLSFLDTIILN